MVEMKALLCSESENMRKLADMLTKNGVSVKVCPAEPLDILQECMTQQPFAVLIEEGAFEYRELVRKISAQSAITKVYILCDPFTPYFDIHSECKDIYYIDNMYKHADILAKLKYSAVDIVKKDYISRETLYQTADNIVHTALNELCFTANYTGSAYLQSSLVALCLSDLKHSRQYVQDDISVYRRPVRRIYRECGAQHTHGDKALLEQFERRGARQIFRIHLFEGPRRADQPRIYHDTRRLADTRDAANDLGLQSKLDVSDINIINFRAIY